MEEQVLTGTARLVNRRMKFECLVEGKSSLIEDYIPPYGDGEGHTSLELLLLGLASCFGSSIGFLIRRSKKEVAGLSVRAQGIRRATHPMGFRRIELLLEIEAPGVVSHELEAMIRQAEENICPVYAMIRGNVEIRTAYSLNGKRSTTSGLQEPEGFPVHQCPDLA